MMAKVQGPLMSISASGSVGKILTFRACRRGSVVQLLSAPTGAPSAAQQSERARMQDARAAYRALTAPERIEWQTLAIARALPAWPLYWQEWQFQHSAAGRPPRIPTMTPGV